MNRKLPRAEGECAVSAAVSGGTRTTVRLRMSIELSASDQGADVSTALLYEPKLPDRFAEPVHASVYEGVHRGIGARGRPIPPSGLAVKVLVLEFDQDGNVGPDSAVKACSDTIVHLVTGMVVSLLSILENEPPL